jgi:hypothetical protein
MTADQDLLGVGVHLDDDGVVVVVLTFGEDSDQQVGFVPQEAALVGAAIINAAAQAANIEVEIADMADEQRAVGITNIRNRYSAGTN